MWWRQISLVYFWNCYRHWRRINTPIAAVKKKPTLSLRQPILYWLCAALGRDHGAITPCLKNCANLFLAPCLSIYVYIHDTYSNFTGPGEWLCVIGFSMTRQCIYTAYITEHGRWLPLIFCMTLVRKYIYYENRTQGTLKNLKRNSTTA